MQSNKFNIKQKMNHFFTTFYFFLHYGKFCILILIGFINRHLRSYLTTIICLFFVPFFVSAANINAVTHHTVEGRAPRIDSSLLTKYLGIKIGNKQFSEAAGNINDIKMGRAQRFSDISILSTIYPPLDAHTDLASTLGIIDDDGDELESYDINVTALKWFQNNIEMTNVQPTDTLCSRQVTGDLMLRVMADVAVKTKYGIPQSTIETVNKDYPVKISSGEICGIGVKNKSWWSDGQLVSGKTSDNGLDKITANGGGYDADFDPDYGFLPSTDLSQLDGEYEAFPTTAFGNAEFTLNLVRPATSYYISIEPRLHHDILRFNTYTATFKFVSKPPLGKYKITVKLKEKGMPIVGEHEFTLKKWFSRDQIVHNEDFFKKTIWYAMSKIMFSPFYRVYEYTYPNPIPVLVAGGKHCRGENRRLVRAPDLINISDDHDNQWGRDYYESISGSQKMYETRKGGAGLLNEWGIRLTPISNMKNALQHWGYRDIYNSGLFLFDQDIIGGSSLVNPKIPFLFDNFADNDSRWTLEGDHSTYERIQLAGPGFDTYLTLKFNDNLQFYARAYGLKLFEGDATHHNINNIRQGAMELYRVNTRDLSRPSVGRLNALYCNSYKGAERCRTGSMVWGTNSSAVNQIQQTNLIIVGGRRSNADDAIITSRDLGRNHDLGSRHSDLLDICVDE